MIFSPKKIREDKFENTPFSIGDERKGTELSGKGCFEYPGSFRDETHGDIKMSGLFVRVMSHRDEIYGDITYRDISY